MTKITCSSLAKFVFYDIHSLQISGIALENCIGNTISSVGYLHIENFFIEYHDDCGTGLELKGINFVNISSSSFSIKNTEPFSNCVSLPKLSAAAVAIENCIDVSIMVVLFADITVKDFSIVYIWNSSVTIDNSSFSNNVVDVNATVYVEDSSLTLLNSTFSNNTCLGSHFSGCALYSVHSLVELENSLFSKQTFVAGGIIFAGDCNFSINKGVFANISSKFLGMLFLS